MRTGDIWQQTDERSHLKMCRGSQGSQLGEGCGYRKAIDSNMRPPARLYSQSSITSPKQHQQQGNKEINMCERMGDIPHLNHHTEPWKVIHYTATVSATSLFL